MAPATTPPLLEGFLTNSGSQDLYKPLTLDVADAYMHSSMDGLFKDLQGAKLMTMHELIEDIEEQIEERKRLQKEVFRDADKTLMDLNNFLKVAGDKIDVIEELRLREKLTAIQEFKMQEKINVFRDVALLKKEMRDRIQHLKEKENNVSMIDQIIGE